MSAQKVGGLSDRSRNKWVRPPPARPPPGLGLQKGYTRYIIMGGQLLFFSRAPLKIYPHVFFLPEESDQTSSRSWKHQPCEWHRSGRKWTGRLVFQSISKRSLYFRPHWYRYTILPSCERYEAREHTHIPITLHPRSIFFRCFHFFILRPPTFLRIALHHRVIFIDACFSVLICFLFCFEAFHGGRSPKNFLRLLS